MTRLLSALLALGLLAGPAPADSPKPVTAITPHPTALKLRGAPRYRNSHLRGGNQDVQTVR